MTTDELGADGPRYLEFYEAIPYLLVVESVEREGAWWRRATHPELPGCTVEAVSAIEAMEKLDGERRRLLREAWMQGLPIPVPRPPLRGAPRTRQPGPPA